MDNSSDDTTVLALTARVVAAHVGHNAVEAAELPDLIRSVYNALSGVHAEPRAVAAAPDAPEADEAETETETETETEALTPAVPPEKSVFNDFIICLECGKKQKTLRRHLQSAHDLTPEDYRDRWDLAAHYPMVAPSYAETRSELAKKIGLGTKRIPRS